MDKNIMVTAKSDAVRRFLEFVFSGEEDEFNDGLSFEEYLARDEALQEQTNRGGH